jgi:hypothetical protein
LNAACLVAVFAELTFQAPDLNECATALVPRDQKLPSPREPDDLQCDGAASRVAAESW